MHYTSQAADCRDSGEATTCYSDIAFGDTKRTQRLWLLSRDQKEENTAFVSKFIGELTPYEEKISDILDTAKEFAQSHQSAILLANQSSMYVCISPGYFLYTHDGVTKRTKRITPEKFTTLGAHYAQLPPDYRILVTAEPIKADNKALDGALALQDGTANARLDGIRDSFSLSGPVGIMSVRTSATHGRGLEGATTGSIVSDRGKVRPVNEDSASLTGISYSNGKQNLRFTIVAVADGVGGLAAGEIASKIGVSASTTAAVTDVIHRSSLSVRDSIIKAFESANEKIVNVVSFTNKSMASTLSMSLLIDNQLYSANAGDTRIYLMKTKNRNSERLTVDHRFVDDGMPTHVITRALGSRDPSPDINGPYDYEEGSRLVTCTDGVHEDVSDDEIAEQTMANANPRLVCENLIRLANSRGGKDNLTVAVLSRDLVAAS